MMPAAKMMDPVMGIDVHLIQPPGPVPPLPVPHPFIGMLYDPMELAPFVGATVFVNGMPKATAGSEGKAVPPHIPIGGVFVPPPPGNECEMFMGSATVLFEGEPASYTALPALSCQSIGVPAPPRAKKKPKPIMKLPLSVVVPIPAGPPVLIGGPPTISLTVIGMKILMGAAGKAAKKLKKAMKASKKVKKVSDKIHKAANKAMKKLGVPPSVQNKVHKGICSVTGHPVDVATGKVFTDWVDIELPGPVPFRLERTWYSTSTYQGPFGHGWHHTYDLALLEDRSAVAVRLADGRPVAFPILAAGGKAFDRSEKLTLSRDDRGYVLQDKSGLRYRFSPRPSGRGENPLVEVADGAGNAIAFAYDPEGRLQAVRDSGGRVLRMAYDELGRIVRIMGPHPNQPDQAVALASFVYDGFGDLVESRDPLGKACLYAYRGHLLVKETDRSGMSFQFEYDRDGAKARCLRTWGDGGLYDHKLSYDAVSGVTEVENSLGHKTVYHHAGGLVHKTIDARGSVELVDRNEFNEVVKRVDALGRASEFQYDDRGNLIGIKEPDGAVQKAVYDDRDLVIEAEDPLGGKWLRSYDEAGRPEAETDALGRRVLYVYDSGKLVLHVDPAGRETGFLYDGESNLAGVRLPDGTVHRWEYDRLGRPVRTIDPRGNVETRVFDLADRAVRVTLADGNVNEMKYDGEGRLVHIKNRHHEVLYTFAGMGRMVSRTENGTEIRFEYDTEERVTGIRNEHGSVFGFVLDPVGDVIEESGFDGLRRRFVRDPAGRVVKVERPGDLFTECEYDGGDRLVKKTHSDGTEESYAFRADGQMMEAANGTASLKWERDILGRVTKEIQDLGWVESAYNIVGFRESFRTSKGLEQRVRRNILGDVVGVQAGKHGFGKPGQGAGGEKLAPESAALDVTFKLDELGFEIERSLPGGVRARWERDRLGRPLRQEILADSVQKVSRKYEWDVNDRLKMIVDSLRGPVWYHHDAFGHLAAVTFENHTAELRMPDSIGNLYRDEHRADRKYGPAGQLLEAKGPSGTTRYEYDAEGNLSRKILPDGKAWTYAWNGEGMLCKVVRPDGAVVEFGYDPMGRRIWKSFRGHMRRWIWDGNVPLHEWEEEDTRKPEAAETPAAGGSAAAADKTRQALGTAVGAQGPPKPFEGTPETPVSWIFDPETHSPLAKLVGERRYGIVVDHEGAPSRMYDDRGQEVWAADYSAYGELRNVEGDRQACPFRWPGQYEDSETGLYYNRFRYYDPEAGEYISQDPWGTDAGLNLYAYVGDPTMEVDIFGLVKGGSYYGVRKSNKGGEVHHMPANSVSPHSTNTGPAIYMSKADHAKTASHGSGKDAKAYRAKQKTHIDNGNFAKAMEMDIKDVSKKFPGKYKDSMKLAIDDAVKRGHITKAEGTKLKKHCK